MKPTSLVLLLLMQLFFTCAHFRLCHSEAADSGASPHTPSSSAQFMLSVDAHRGDYFVVKYASEHALTDQRNFYGALPYNIPARLSCSSKEFTQSLGAEDGLKRRGMSVLKGKLFLNPISSLFLPRFHANTNTIWKGALTASGFGPSATPFEKLVGKSVPHAVLHDEGGDAELHGGASNGDSAYHTRRTAAAEDSRSADVSEELSEVLAGTAFEPADLHHTGEVNDFADAFHPEEKDTVDVVEEYHQHRPYFDLPSPKQWSHSSYLGDPVRHVASFGGRNSSFGLKKDFSSETAAPNRKHLPQSANDKSLRGTEGFASPVDLQSFDDNAGALSESLRHPKSTGHTHHSGSLFSKQHSLEEEPESAPLPSSPAAQHNTFDNPPSRAGRPSTPVRARSTSAATREVDLPATPETRVLEPIHQEGYERRILEPMHQEEYVAPKTRPPNVAAAPPSPAAASHWSVSAEVSPFEATSQHYQRPDPTSHTESLHRQNASATSTLTISSTNGALSSSPTQKPSRLVLGSPETRDSFSATGTRATTSASHSPSATSQTESVTPAVLNFSSSSYFSFPSPSSPSLQPASTAEVATLRVNSASDTLGATSAAPSPTSSGASSRATAAYSHFPSVTFPSATQPPRTLSAQTTPSSRLKPFPSSPKRNQEGTLEDPSSVPNSPEQAEQHRSSSPSFSSPHDDSAQTVFPLQRHLLHTSPPYTPSLQVADDTHASTASILRPVQQNDAFQAAHAHAAEHHALAPPSLKSNVPSLSSEVESTFHLQRTVADYKSVPHDIQHLLSNTDNSSASAQRTVFQFPSTSFPMTPEDDRTLLLKSSHSASSLSFPVSAQPRLLQRTLSAPSFSLPSPAALPSSAPLSFSPDNHLLAVPPSSTAGVENFKKVASNVHTSNVGADSTRGERNFSSPSPFDTTSPVLTVPSYIATAPSSSEVFLPAGDLAPDSPHLSSSHVPSLHANLPSFTASHLNSVPFSPVPSVPVPSASASSATGAFDRDSPSFVEKLTDNSNFAVSRRPSDNDQLESSFSPSSPAPTSLRKSTTSPLPSLRTYPANQMVADSPLFSGITSMDTESSQIIAAVPTSPRLHSPVDASVLLDSDGTRPHFKQALLNSPHWAADKAAEEDLAPTDLAYQKQQAGDISPVANARGDEAAGSPPNDSNLKHEPSHQLPGHAGTPALEQVDTCLELDAELVGGELLNAFPGVANLALCIALCHDVADNYCTHFSYYTKRNICLLRSAGADLQFLSESNGKSNREEYGTFPGRPVAAEFSAEAQSTTTPVTGTLKNVRSAPTSRPHQSPTFDDITPLESRPAAAVLSGKLRGADESCFWRHSILIEQKPDSMRRGLAERLRHDQGLRYYEEWEAHDSSLRGADGDTQNSSLHQVDYGYNAEQLHFQKMDSEEAEGDDSVYERHFDEGSVEQEIDAADPEEETVHEQEDGEERQESEEEGEDDGEEGREEGGSDGDVSVEDHAGPKADAAGMQQKGTRRGVAVYADISTANGKSQTHKLDEDNPPPSHFVTSPFLSHAMNLGKTRNAKQAGLEIHGRRLQQNKGSTSPNGDTPRTAKGHPLLGSQWRAAAAALVEAAERALLELEHRQKQQHLEDQSTVAHTSQPVVGDHTAKEIPEQDIATTVAAAAVAVAVEQGLLALETEGQKQLFTKTKNSSVSGRQQRHGPRLGTLLEKNGQTGTAQNRNTANDDLSCSLDMALGGLVNPECRAKVAKALSKLTEPLSVSPPSSSASRKFSPEYTSPRRASVTAHSSPQAPPSPSVIEVFAPPVSPRGRSPTSSYTETSSSPSASNTSSALPSYAVSTSIGTSSPVLSPVTPPRSPFPSSAPSFSAAAQPRRLGVEEDVAAGVPAGEAGDRHMTVTQASVVAAAIAEALLATDETKLPAARSSSSAAQLSGQSAQRYDTSPAQEERRVNQNGRLSAEGVHRSASIRLPAVRPVSQTHRKPGTRKGGSRKNSTRSGKHSTRSSFGKRDTGSAIDGISTRVHCGKGVTCEGSRNTGSQQNMNRHTGGFHKYLPAKRPGSYASAQPENLGKPNASLCPPEWFLPVSTSSSPSCPLEWQLTKEFKGWDVFDEQNFWFFSFDDPTHGYVNYVPRQEALRKRLISVTKDGRAIIRADAWNKVPVGARGRDSVRLTSTKGYDDVIWVISVNHVPAGCSLWPALWTLGPPPWPDSGEIDIYEGVNRERYNHVSLHTSKGCTMWNIPETTFSGVWAYAGGGMEARDCWAFATPTNSGCAIEALEESFGEPLNAQGGGVFVMELKRDSHVRVWFFQHHEVPRDLAEGHPVPDLWALREKLPQAAFPLGPNCPGKEKFALQRLVINLTFCGDWAGHAFSTEQGCPGVGAEACQRFVQDTPEAFKSAFWDINFIQVYTPNQGACGRRLHAPNAAGATQPVAGVYDSSGSPPVPSSPGSTVILNPNYVPNASQFHQYGSVPSVTDFVSSQPHDQQPQRNRERHAEPPSYGTESGGFFRPLQSAYQQSQQPPYTSYQLRQQQYEQQHSQYQQDQQHKEQQQQQLQQLHVQRYQQQLLQYQQQLQNSTADVSSSHSVPPQHASTPAYPTYSRHSAHQQQPMQYGFYPSQDQSTSQLHETAPSFPSHQQQGDHHLRPPSFSQQHKQQRPPSSARHAAVMGPSAAPGTQSMQQREWWATLLDVVAQLSGQPAGRCNERDVVYYGFDVKTYNGYVPFTWQCRVLCSSNAACFFFTHSPEEASCDLKSIEALKGRLASQPGFISGQKVCRNVDDEDTTDIERTI